MGGRSGGGGIERNVELLINVWDLKMHVRELPKWPSAESFSKAEDQRLTIIV